MKILVACEYSGRVREAFRKKGHDAWSCDLLPSEDESPFHLQKDCFEVIPYGWDVIIAHPPCTDLCNSGSRWWKEKRANGSQDRSVSFFTNLVSSMTASAKSWAVENPIGIMSTRFRKPDQIIQPWQYGHGETKGTCLWLHNLPKLVPSNVVDGRMPKCHMMAPSKDRWKERSRTYSGIAEAMAAQWSPTLSPSVN